MPPVSQVDANAAYAGFMHRVKIGARRFFIDNSDAAGAFRTELFNAVECRGTVGAVDARRDDDDMIHVQRLLKSEQIVGRRDGGV